MNTPSSRAKNGWSEAETGRLFSMAEAAAKTGSPLKCVFDEFAAESRRRPNSVRNYYYSRIKQEAGSFPHTPAFVPFTENESRLLLERVLTALAGGESVRACTLRMGGGDDKAMLRFQNKYRSLIKTKPALVRETVARLRENGVACPDPYERAAGKKRAGRPRLLRPALDPVGDVFSELSLVEGLDVDALMTSLGALAVSAVNGAKAQRALNAGSSAPDDAHALKKELELLRARLMRQRDRYSALIRNFRQLIRVNTEFLKMNSVVKVSNLSNYIRDLETNVQTCQELVHEHASS